MLSEMNKCLSHKAFGKREVTVIPVLDFHNQLLNSPWLWLNQLYLIVSLELNSVSQISLEEEYSE